MEPADPVPRVSAGRIRLRSRGTKPSPIPWEGSHPSFRAKSITTSSPNQKLGMDTPMRDRTMEMLSMIVFCFLADRIPNGRPMSSATRMPAMASTTVLGKRSVTCSQTEMLLR